MPKYQIILESNEQIPSDEFRDTVEFMIHKNVDDGNGIRFKILEARNLQGIRPEVWQANGPVQRYVREGKTVEIRDSRADISDLLS